VEGSLVLTASSLVRKKAFVPGARTSSSWGWTYEDKLHASMETDEATIRAALRR
jgi:hypothetical protein